MALSGVGAATLTRRLAGLLGTVASYAPGPGSEDQSVMGSG